MSSSMLLCWALFVASLWQAPASSTELPGLAMRSLEACRVDLTELGRRVNFNGATASYRAVVNSDGVVVEIKPHNDTGYLSQFVQIGQFESCIQRWQFSEPGEYLILFQAGTTGRWLEEWEIDMSLRMTNKSLRVVIPGFSSNMK